MSQPGWSIYQGGGGERSEGVVGVRWSEGEGREGRSEWSTEGRRRRGLIAPSLSRRPQANARSRSQILSSIDPPPPLPHPYIYFFVVENESQEVRRNSHPRTLFLLSVTD